MLEPANTLLALAGSNTIPKYLVLEPASVSISKYELAYG